MELPLTRILLVIIISQILYYLLPFITGGDTFKQNQIWTYKSATASTYNSQGSSSKTSVWMAQIYVERKGVGIILRLIVPLFLLLLLAAVTFWMTTEERVNVTITIMLSVSALYIVILGNIPLVGYLTDLDKFVFWVSKFTAAHAFHFILNVIDVLTSRNCCHVTPNLCNDSGKARHLPFETLLFSSY